MKPKSINCSECSKLCYTGKRGLCDTCYAKYLKRRQKEKNAKERKTRKVQSDREKNSIKKTKLLPLVQKLVRLCTPDYCCTCYSTFGEGRMKTGGHFVSSSRSATAFYVKNIHQQCSHCNSDQATSGKMYAHAKYIDKTYGEGTADIIWNLSVQTYRFARHHLLELRDVTLSYINKAENINSLKDREALLKEYLQWQEGTEWWIEITKDVRV